MERMGRAIFPAANCQMRLHDRKGYRLEMFTMKLLRITFGKPHSEEHHNL
jgi:hypothetical protein